MCHWEVLLYCFLVFVSKIKILTQKQWCEHVPSKKKNIHWANRKESSAVTKRCFWVHLMSPLLQSRQHSVQDEELSWALHQLLIDLHTWKIQLNFKESGDKPHLEDDKAADSRWPWSPAWQGPGGTPRGRGGYSSASTASEYSAASCWSEHPAGSGPAVLRRGWRGPEETRVSTTRWFNTGEAVSKQSEQLATTQPLLG